MGTSSTPSQSPAAVTAYPMTSTSGASISPKVKNGMPRNPMRP